MAEIRIEWCENFIRHQFGPRHHAFANSPTAGIEVNCFWNAAEKSGLWVRGTYGSPMSQALANLTEVVSVKDDEGNYAYTIFRLK